MAILRTVVIPHDCFKPLFADWRRGLSINREQRAIIARTAWEALVQRIVKADNIPHDAVKVSRKKTGTYFWLEFQGVTWVELWHRPVKFFEKFPPVREVIVVNLASHPPDRAR